MSEKEGWPTFSQQGTLPSLPVPSIEDTMQRYRNSVSALADGYSLASTLERVSKFESSDDARLLQSQLLQRQREEINWVDSWWYDSYNECRTPLPLQNMGAIVPSLSGRGSQLHRASELVYNLMDYWLALRRQTVPVVTSRGNVWDMSQYYNIFNACRTPAEPRDRLQRFFCTELEGSAPSHIVVIHNGYLFRMELLCGASVVTLSAIYHTLSDIMQRSQYPIPSVASLTSLNRNKWAVLNNHIQHISSSNKENLDCISSAVFVLSLSSDMVKDESELMFYALFGNPSTQWCDKNFTCTVLKDGRVCLQADHSNVDAISLFAPFDYVSTRLIPKQWDAEDTAFTPALLLHFDLTPVVVANINFAETVFRDMAQHICVKPLVFEDFGSKRLKEAGFHPDTVVQIAMQLAFYRLHKKFAATYETASTRKFLKGRTETIRSCTVPMVMYGKSVANGMPIAEQRRLFQLAYEAHNRLAEDARNGQGIDRHLFGLQQMSELLKAQNVNISLHGLFDDENWTKSGGNGNFQLSTSLLGYNPDGTYGYVTAMCENGYGCFYKIGPASITFTLSCYRNAKTDLENFSKSLQWALSFIYTLIITDDSCGLNVVA